MQKEAKEAFLNLPPALTLKQKYQTLITAGYSMSFRTAERWQRQSDSTDPYMLPPSTPEPESSVEVIHGEYQNQHAGLSTMPDGVYVLTSAQSDTYIHEDFLSSLLQYCQARSARLLIAPVMYNVKKNSRWFDPRITDYLVSAPVRFASDLVFGAGINVLPTVARPLAGFASYFREGSGIIPHTKMHLASLPRYKGTDPRFLFTTGTVTRRNYTETKSGAIADFHHVFGALVVEVRDSKWFIRQLVADESGSFHDLDGKFTPTGYTTGEPVTAITWGDLHREALSPTMIGTMLDITKELHPELTVCHDVLDFGARSYHNKDNWDVRKRMYIECSDNVQSMLDETGAILNLLNTESKVIVAPSNHDKHLERWLTSPPENFDFENIATYHHLNYIKHTTAYKTVLEMALKELGDAWGVQFLGEDESYELNGIEYSLHGDSGPNGSRGSPNNLRGIGVKLNTGHTHSASIVDGVYTGGCMCSLDLGYNTGPSSWSNSFILTYQNGKRTIVTVRDEKHWRIHGRLCPSHTEG